MSSDSFLAGKAGAYVNGEATTTRQRCLQTRLAKAASAAGQIMTGAPIVIGAVVGLRDMLATASP
jgi:siroheme synthase